VKIFVKSRVLAPAVSLVERLTRQRLPQSLSDLEYERPYALRIPTYDGSGQAVHPDICVDPITGKVLMAYTPYPFSMDRFENPSLVASDDGLRFFVERGTVNPLAGPPPKDHNDDPDIFYREGTWNVLYLETLRPETQNLRLLQSRDRKIWTNRILVSMDLFSSQATFMLSPSFVAAPWGSYVFYVNINYPGYRIERFEMSPDSSMHARFYLRCKVDVAMGSLSPWHIDLVKDESAYYMLITTIDPARRGPGRYSLHIAKSEDLVRWTVSQKTVLDDAYRSSALVKGNDLFVYYSRDEGPWGVWRIGVYRTKISSYF
jgi:hypothetical protein